MRSGSPNSGLNASAKQLCWEPELVFQYSAFLQCTKAKYATLFLVFVIFFYAKRVQLRTCQCCFFSSIHIQTKMSALKHALQAIFWFMGPCGGGNWPDDKKSL